MSPLILIIAHAARMLTQNAHQEGFVSVTVDLYADEDTRRYALRSETAASLQLADLAPVISDLTQRYQFSHAIYGSGLEAAQNSLDYLAQHLPLAGNPPETFAQVTDKKTFFSVLLANHIPFPDTCFSCPETPGAWLHKPSLGQGGLGIRHWQPNSAHTDGYWQRHHSGEAHSALFLADGISAKIIGFNRQWTQAIADNGFLFAGISNQTELTPQQQILLTRWLAKLVPLFGLKGLNSLDFLRDGDDLALLEINARPPASLQLYGGGLVQAHLQTSAGRWPNLVLPPTTPCAYQLVYAQEPLTIPSRFLWPAECVDIPPPGRACLPGEPICGLLVREKSAQKLRDQLQYSVGVLMAELRRFS